MIVAAYSQHLQQENTPACIIFGSGGPANIAIDMRLAGHTVAGRF
jgi:hypothetical protein